MSPATAPMLIKMETYFNPLEVKASAKGASSPRNLYGTIPVITKQTAIYNPTQIRRLPSMPIGRSRCQSVNNSINIREQEGSLQNSNIPIPEAIG